MPEYEPDAEKLLSYGFEKNGEKYCYRALILEGQFLFTAEVSSGELTARLTDVLTEEPYTLHLVQEAAGPFVGSVRAEYDKLLQSIYDSCFLRPQGDFLKSAQAYIASTYGDEPEYLWQRFPDSAIWRRKDSKKWYGVKIKVAREKLLPGEKGEEEVLVLRGDAALLTNGVTCLPGYHMNKKSWVTVRAGYPEVERLIDESYRLAKK